MIREKKVGKQTYYLIFSTAQSKPYVLRVCNSQGDAEAHLKRLRWEKPHFFV